MSSIFIQFGLVLMLLTCGFGLLKGGPAERLGSILILASYAADNILVAATLPRFPTFWIFVSDFALAGALLFVAIRYSSLWLGGAMMLQGIALCSYAFAVTADGVHGQARSYVMLNNVLSLLMLGCILIGTIASMRRRGREQKSRIVVQDTGSAIA